MKKLILFELRKVFSKRLALIALIGIILFSALLSFSTFQNKYAFDQNIGEGTGKTAVEIDKEIAAKYEGILTDEKVQQMMSDFAPTFTWLECNLCLSKRHAIGSLFTVF